MPIRPNEHRKIDRVSLASRRLVVCRGDAHLVFAPLRLGLAAAGISGTEEDFEVTDQMVRFLRQVPGGKRNRNPHRYLPDAVLCRYRFAHSEPQSGILVVLDEL